MKEGKGKRAMHKIEREREREREGCCDNDKRKSVAEGEDVRPLARTRLETVARTFVYGKRRRKKRKFEDEPNGILAQSTVETRLL